MKKININPLDRSNSHLRRYFEGKSFLIVDPSNTIRPIIKKLMIELKAEQINKVPETFAEYEDIINSTCPYYIFSTQNFKNKSVEPLVNLHTQIRPDRMNSGFYVITDNNSMASASSKIDSEIDAVISAPFTKQSVYKTLFQSFNKKAKPSEYDKLVNEGRKSFFEEDFETATQPLREAKFLGKKPVLAHYYLGLIEFKNKNFDQAIGCFEQALMIKQDHYRSLNRYLESALKINNLKKAYSAASTILDHYPIPADKIPTFIKLSVANQKYEDIFRYAELFTDLEERNDDLHKHIAAGLAICGKYFLKANDLKKGKEILVKASEMARGNFQIIQTVCLTLISHKITCTVDEIMLRVGEYHEFSEEYKVFEFEIFSYYGKPAKIVQEGLNYIQKGVKTPRIYEAVIKASIDIERKKDLIEDIVIEAKKAFPEHGNKYERMLKNISY
ncbi:MAG: tetratricopeptide repeat protein [Bacteriovoracaceae bacterium]